MNNIKDEQKIDIKEIEKIINVIDPNNKVFNKTRQIIKEKKKYNQSKKEDETFDKESA